MLILNEFNAELLTRHVIITRAEGKTKQDCAALSPFIVDYFALNPNDKDGVVSADVYYSEIGNPRAPIGSYPKKLVGEHVMTFLTTGLLLNRPLVTYAS